MEKQVDFRYSPFKEDVGIFGKKGEGKTTRAKMILDVIPNIPRWIWSPQRPNELYQGYGEPIEKIEDLKYGACLYIGTYNRENFNKFCKRAMEFQNLILVIDDVHEYISKQFIPPEVETLILSGRNRGISTIYISPFPQKVHNSILGNCTHIFAYRFVLQIHIEWLKENFFGDEAWLLVPKDKRNKFYKEVNDPNVIPAYSFLYRKDTDARTQIMIPNYPIQAEKETISEESLNEESIKEETRENVNPDKES